MKTYSRKILKRAKINRYGKLGYVEVKECVKTDNIDRFNKGKRIKFTECEDMKIKPDLVFEFEEE